MTGLKKKLAQVLKKCSECLLTQEAKAENSKREVTISIIEPMPILAMNSKLPWPTEKSRKVLFALRCNWRALNGREPVGSGFGDRYISSKPFSFSKSPALGRR